ncbi:MAG: hypothetical protein V1926_06455 [Candidatus Peregrinibacteria bacterium]
MTTPTAPSEDITASQVIDAVLKAKTIPDAEKQKIFAQIQEEDRISEELAHQIGDLLEAEAASFVEDAQALTEAGQEHTARLETLHEQLLHLDGADAAHAKGIVEATLTDERGVVDTTERRLNEYVEQQFQARPDQEEAERVRAELFRKEGPADPAA